MITVRWDAPPPRWRTRLLPPEVRRSWELLVRHDPRTALTWAGVVWSRLARGDLASRCWQAAADGLDPAAEPPAARPAWLAAERGRVLRELGLHEAAAQVELPALTRTADPVDRAMLLLSLAADAIGHGDAAAARAWHDRALVRLAAAPDTPRAARQQLRAVWVRIELALLTGAPDDAAGLPGWEPGHQRPWFPAAYAHGTDFHAAKGLLFAGVLHRDLTLLDEAAHRAPPVLAWGIQLARHDVGARDALARARSTWARVVPPNDVRGPVARTAVARWLASP